MADSTVSKGVRRRATLTVEQLASALDAQLVRPDARDANVAEAELAWLMLRHRLIDHTAGLANADRSTLVFAEDAAALAIALDASAGAIFLPGSLAAIALQTAPSDAALLVVEHPRVAFARAALLLRPVEPPRGIHERASIAPGANIGQCVSISAFAVVETGATIGAGTEIGAGAVIGAGVSIGVDCRIYPRVVIYPGTTLGDRVVVHAGAVLGADGFGYVRDPATGTYLQFPQQGTLVLEDDVEIGANTAIDRGALDQTHIARGVKLDNLVHIGHNVSIGEDTVIAAQVGISGSSTVGAGVMLGGQAGIGDHAHVGPGVALGGQGGVLPHKHLEGPGQLFWGTPAKPVKQWLRELATLTRLARRLRQAAAGLEGEGK